MRYLLLLGICLLTAQADQAESQLDPQLQGLSSPDIRTRDRALYALLNQNGIAANAPSTTQARVGGLLRTHPQQAGRIKTALIAALEKAAEEYEALVKNDRQVPDDLAEWCNALSDTVSALRDPRAASALFRTGNLEGVADICPSAIDRIIGWGANASAVRTLGFCLLGPAMIRANPALEAKIKRQLLADLDSSDWTLLEVAAESLRPLGKDPEVRAKLQRIAARDPYHGPQMLREGLKWSRVRERAKWSLDPPDAFSYYATRTSDSRVCQVRPASQTNVQEALFGPETADFVRRNMCDHYDPTGHDASLCWKVEPANACNPGIGVSSPHQ
jgi:hypothetical protein